MKKPPLRQCIGCREMKPKQELTRVVKTTQGEIFVDDEGKVDGRGAYICKDNNTECKKRAEKTKAFGRAFKTSVPEEIWTKL